MSGATRFGLSLSSIVKMSEVFRRWPQVERVVIYGSRAKGTFRDGSDIDLTIVGSLSLQECFAIETELDDLLLIQKIDLSLLSSIENRSLLDHIERVGKTFYERGGFPHEG